MYDFADLAAAPQAWVSDVAMTINGVAFDNDKTHTLTVEGRKLIGNTVSYFPDMPARDGSVVQNEKIPARTLKIKYVTQESEYARLNAMLRTGEDLEIQFADEPYSYYGRVTGVTSKVVSNSGEITVVCGNPFKFGVLSEFTGAVVSADSPHPLEIVKLRVLTTSNVSKVTVSNRGRSIILNGEFLTGDVVEITKTSITRNGQNIMGWLDYAQSYYHDFKVYGGDTVEATGTLTITAREKWL